MTEQLDYTVSDHGSVVLVTPESDAAKDWLAANVYEDSQWFGPSLVVEPRYAGELLYAMQGDGLTSNVTVEAR